MTQIIELKNKIDATKSQIEKLSALLIENALTDLTPLAPELIQHKNDLLVELKLGNDVSDELVKIEERIISAQKVDAKNKAQAATQRDFVKSIQSRLDAENAALNALTVEYNKQCADYVMTLIDKSEITFLKMKSDYEKEIIKGQVLENIITSFDGGLYKQRLSDNAERYHKLWRQNGGLSENETKIDVDTVTATKQLATQLEKVGIVFH